MLNPNEKCAVFLDIDGTLIHNSFKIPQPNLDAIAAARAKGHMVFINTGRSWGNIPEELRAQFKDLDGIVAGSGAMIIIDGKEVCKSCIDNETVLAVCDYFLEETNCWCVFEGYKTNYVLANAGYEVRERRQNEVRTREELAKYLETDEIQVIAAGETVPDDFLEKFGDEMDFFIMRTYADCVLKGNSKANGIRKVLEITGIKRENTIAIGDSSNDLAMLEYAGVSVAMANSQQHILDMADYITASNAEAGVAKAINDILELD